ncbi:DNA replication complex GINS protein Sld5p [[Candida] railenensis]|uniref:DNA replication complex GINS protein SLD5 n=1 Tax=[Candida] railenensis TaxID=45579 RepID=A0A9P0QQS0_9ASCO|nr:DNA replication complex GINS protein Sld5p [[Candida] railenensis]
MDIDDILLDFEKSAAPKRSSKIESDLYNRLVTAMVNERMAPDVLPYEHSLLQSVLLMLSQQQQYLLDSHEYGDSNIGSGIVSSDFKLQLMIVETEIERLNYLVRSYLRVRLAKLDKFNIFYINQVNDSKSNGRDTKPLLSQEETEYIHKHFKILTQLYNSCFLKKMPHFLTLLDDTSGGQSMVVEPDIDQPVFIKVVSKTPITLLLTQDEDLELERDGIYVVKYRLVKKYIEIGDILLI